MNTIQINKVLTNHVKYFQGVYPIHLLPSTLIKPSIIVMNLDKHYMPGWHWIAVCISDSGYDEYLDSYSLPPYKLEIMSFMQSNSISWKFNSNRLQDVTSDFCGRYCCIYGLHTAKGQSMTSFVNVLLPARYTCNDKRAVRMFHA